MTFDLATIQAIFSALSGIAAFLIKYGPGFIQSVENIVADLELAWKTATSGQPITAEQQKHIDDTLDSANNRLAAAIAAAEAADGTT